ncbi:MAG: response regulator transcription factor [Neisseriaceae bacterium]
MQTKLLDYINALNIIHKNDNFWVLDNNFELKYNNSIHSLKSLSVVSNNEIVNSLLKYLTINYYKLNKSNEIVVFSKTIDPNHLLLLNVNKIISNNQLLGYFLILQGKVDDFEYSKILNLLLYKGKHLEDSKIILGEREQEILYLVSRGKSYKDIAILLSNKYRKKIAPTTVASVVQHSLYKKFNVLNMIELKNRAIELNLINHIPPSLLNHK